MTFKVSMSEKFWSPVHAEIQTESGARQPVKFMVQFKRLKQDELADFARRSREAMDESTEQGNTSPTHVATEYLKEIVTDWKELIDDDNAALPFNADNLTALVNLGLGGAIYTAFYKSLPKAREKNS